MSKAVGFNTSGAARPLLLSEGESPNAAVLEDRAPGVLPMISPRRTSFLYQRGTYPRNLSACALAEEATLEKAVEQRKTQRKLIMALVLAFIFMIVEVAAGVYAHSLAVLTDAAHLLSDVSGFAISVFAAFWVAKKSQDHFSYGYHRVEVLGALASVMMIWLVTGILVVEAIQRVITPEDVNGKIMCIVALAGIGVNLLMMAVLGGHHHGHGHSHSHGEACGDHGHGHSHGHGKPETVAELSRSSSVTVTEQQAAEYNQQQQQHAHAHSHDSECGHHHDHSEGGEVKPSGEPDLEAGDSSSKLLMAGQTSATPLHEEAGHDHGHEHGSGGGARSGGGSHAHSAAGEAAGHGHGHSHDHNHDHGHSHGGGGGHGHSHGGNINLRGAVLHVIGDLLQSVGVALAGALIWWHQDNPAWYIVDPICTFVFAVLVMWTTITILRDIADVLMERVPRGLCIKTINDDLSRLPGVADVHDLHVWSLTPGIPLLCAHLTLMPDGDATDVLHAANTYCRRLGVEHSTFQLVAEGRACPCAGVEHAH